MNTIQVLWKAKDVLTRLQDPVSIPFGWEATCPCCGMPSSLHMGFREDGTVYLYCQEGCEEAAIRRALGLKPIPWWRRFRYWLRGDIRPRPIRLRTPVLWGNEDPFARPSLQARLHPDSSTPPSVCRTACNRTADLDDAMILHLAGIPAQWEPRMPETLDYPFGPVTLIPGTSPYARQAMLEVALWEKEWGKACFLLDVWGEKNHGRELISLRELAQAEGLAAVRSTMEHLRRMNPRPLAPEDQDAWVNAWMCKDNQDRFPDALYVPQPNPAESAVSPMPGIRDVEWRVIGEEEASAWPEREAPGLDGTDTPGGKWRDRTGRNGIIQGTNPSEIRPAVV